jgi:DNA-binding PadR family transcriptional regulator
MKELWPDKQENDIFNNEIRKGFLKAILLKTIQENPIHGYDIIQHIKEKTGGRWTPSPGSIYPALDYLESKGYISCQDVERKKVYTITPKGDEAIVQMDRKKEEIRKELSAFFGNI